MALRHGQICSPGFGRLLFHSSNHSFLTERKEKCNVLDFPKRCNHQCPVTEGVWWRTGRPTTQNTTRRGGHLYLSRWSCWVRCDVLCCESVRNVIVRPIVWCRQKSHPFSPVLVNNNSKQPPLHNLFIRFWTFTSFFTTPLHRHICPSAVRFSIVHVTKLRKMRRPVLFDTLFGLIWHKRKEFSRMRRNFCCVMKRVKNANMLPEKLSVKFSVQLFFPDYFLNKEKSNELFKWFLINEETSFFQWFFINEEMSFFQWFLINEKMSFFSMIFD